MELLDAPVGTEISVNGERWIKTSATSGKPWKLEGKGRGLGSQLLAQAEVSTGGNEKI